jgi:hypothetical protein
MMPTIELTFRVPVAEETLAEIRAAQNDGEYGTEDALSTLRDAMPGAQLTHVGDENR